MLFFNLDFGYRSLFQTPPVMQVMQYTMATRFYFHLFTCFHSCFHFFTGTKVNMPRRKLRAHPPPRRTCLPPLPVPQTLPQLLGALLGPRVWTACVVWGNSYSQSTHISNSFFWVCPIIPSKIDSWSASSKGDSRKLSCLCTNWPSLACSNTSVCGQADQYSFQRWRWTKSNVSFCQMLLVISNWLIALNSATNFFIYCLAGAKFRQVTKKDKPARLRFFSWMGNECCLHHLLHIIVIWNSISGKKEIQTFWNVI